MSQARLTPERRAQRDDLLEAVLEAGFNEDGLALFITASGLRAKLEALVASDPRPAYLIACLRSGMLERSAPNSHRTARRNGRAAAQVEPARPIQVRAVIETIEGLYRHGSDVTLLERTAASVISTINAELQSLGQMRHRCRQHE